MHFLSIKAAIIITISGLLLAVVGIASTFSQPTQIVSAKLGGEVSNKPAQPNPQPAVVLSAQVTAKESRVVAAIPHPPAYVPAGNNYYTGQGIGLDISYPQCIVLPATPDNFAIIGVTGGKAFRPNGCLGQEFRWGRAGRLAPSLYMNLNAPAGTTVSQGYNGPAGDCAPADNACRAYNYGFNAAQYAKGYADSVYATAGIWWIDVEVYNTWSPIQTLNAKTIQGAIDFLNQHGVTAGIYSTPSNYAAIAGSYHPGVPTWIAGGAHHASEATVFCGDSLTGGPVWLTQYVSGNLDYDVPCT